MELKYVPGAHGVKSFGKQDSEKVRESGAEHRKYLLLVQLRHILPYHLNPGWRDSE